MNIFVAGASGALGMPIQNLGGACIVAGAHPVFPEPGEEGGIVKNDAVGDPAGRLVPYLLLVLRLKAEFPEVRMGNRPPELVVAIPAV